MNLFLFSIENKHNPFNTLGSRFVLLYQNPMICISKSLIKTCKINCSRNTVLETRSESVVIKQAQNLGFQFMWQQMWISMNHSSIIRELKAQEYVYRLTRSYKTLHYEI